MGEPTIRFNWGIVPQPFQTVVISVIPQPFQTVL